MSKSGTVVPTYSQQAQPTTTINPNFPAGSPSAFGTGIAQETQKLGDTMSKLGTEVQQHAVKMQEAADDNTVIQKDNELQSALSDKLYGDNGLISQQGHNAEGITKKFTKAVDDALPDIQKSMIGPNMQQKFQKYINSWMPQMRNVVAKHEAEQIQSAHVADIHTGIDNKIDNAAQIPGATSMATLNVSLGQYIGDLEKYLGLDEAGARDYLKGRASTAFVGMAAQLAQAGNVDELTKLVDYGKGKINADAWTKAQGLIAPVQNQITAHTNVDQMISSGKYNNADGTINLGKLNEDIENAIGANATKSVTEYVPGQGGSQLWQIAQKVSKLTGIQPKFIYGQLFHESGGGNSQLAKENLNFAGLTQTTPNGEDNKQPDGSNYYKKYNNIDDFASDYATSFLNKYSGLKEATTTQEYAQALHNQGYYTAPVSEYVAGMDSAISSMDSSSGTPGTYQEKQVSAYNPELYKQEMAYAQSKVANIKYEHDTTISNAIYTLLKQYPKGTLHSYADITSVVAQAGYAGTDALTITRGLAANMSMEQADESQAFSEQSRARARQNWAQDDASKAAASWLLSNPNATQADFLAQGFAGSMNPKEVLSISNAMQRSENANDPYKWYKGANIAAFDGAVSTFKLDGIEKANIRDAVTTESERRKSAGEPPMTDQEIRTMVSDQAASVSVNGGFFGTTVKRADIPAGFTVRGSQVYGPNGEAVTYDSDSHRWVAK